MRILCTNNTLDARHGTELYTLETALAMRARGHQVAAFTLDPGAVAEEMRAAGIPVTHDLRDLESAPDVIHGHHAIEATLAAMFFPHVPVISFCHGPEAWQEAPCRLPNTACWVAVDEACRRRLVEEEGIPADRVEVVLNFFDARRIPARGPLPDKPLTALVFSNYLDPEHPVFQAIREACEARDIGVNGLGARFGTASKNPGEDLARADLVFAKARCALEAMACGCAVIQADHFGAGRLVTPENIDELRLLNFGYRSMTFEATPARFLAEIDRYDAAACATVAARIRDEAGVDAAMDRIEALYQRAAAFPVPAFAPVREASTFLAYQMYLSKIPMSGLVKTKKVPLRLPTPDERRPPRVVWRETAAAHTPAPDKQAGRKLEQLAARLAAKEMKIEDLKRQISELREKPRGPRGWWHRIRNRRFSSK